MKGETSRFRFTPVSDFIFLQREREQGRFVEKKQKVFVNEQNKRGDGRIRLREAIVQFLFLADGANLMEEEIRRKR